ncbi:OVARIAN TUMOR DOMAIN-containing deubiquitinating enzyme 4 [Impatiens glandulifera]|uniref:OVARIAN TUMOR DOMAIN-containing deubiquitinating enzyme 4 n=1 Tax=Impatiens glandulifera TaxID=253017 RepID=UPI001FB15A63|nr:OVARIAN TUMOR DOMAIN-containing deubiquitinating enzyme 4 [Impatiens glandulifera]XP_047342453.1 OVARIAN TUMOR DOMAIN-containing deubiquitinating enzyme 4 [Impatiens glandulifera]
MVKNLKIMCSSLSMCAKNAFQYDGYLQRQMGNDIGYLASQGSSTSVCFSNSTSFSKPTYFNKSFTRAKNYSTIVNTQASRDSFSGLCISKQRGNIHSLSLKSAVSSENSQICLDISSGCHNMNVKFMVQKQRMTQQLSYKMGGFTGSGGGLIVGLLICYSTSENVHAEAAQPKQSREDSSVMFSQKKKVWTDYSVIGIPGDGRCLFRSVAHGACLRSGKPAPNGSLQKELADKLRVLVADEFVKRRKETEWFVEGEFDAYVSEIRKPLVWGGEPELFMASHVLQMPITVYMIDENSGGLISIVEYGQEEYGKENPIQVLYHGFGHYDALLIPGNKGPPKSRL